MHYFLFHVLSHHLTNFAPGKQEIVKSYQQKHVCHFFVLRFGAQKHQNPPRQPQVFDARSVGKDDDEAGIWMLVDKHEQELRTSNKIIQNPELTDHLHSLICQVAEDNCNEIKTYVIRSPGFNAFMMANGSMFVQTGLLLRIHDESELAAVLGHEASHFVRKHSIKQIRAWKKTSSMYAVAGALIGAALLSRKEN